jgi:hypothetical protein
MENTENKALLSIACMLLFGVVQRVLVLLKISDEDRRRQSLLLAD